MITISSMFSPNPSSYLLRVSVFMFPILLLPQPFFSSSLCLCVQISYPLLSFLLCVFVFKMTNRLSEEI
jgi:hypothetical protein